MTGAAATTGQKGPGPAGKASRLLGRDGFPTRKFRGTIREDGVYVRNADSGGVTITAAFERDEDVAQTTEALRKALTDHGYEVRDGNAPGVLVALETKTGGKARSAPQTAGTRPSQAVPAVTFSSADSGSQSAVRRPSRKSPSPSSVRNEDVALYEAAGYSHEQAVRLAGLLAEAQGR